MLLKVHGSLRQSVTGVDNDPGVVHSTNTSSVYRINRKISGINYFDGNINLRPSDFISSEIKIPTPIKKESGDVVTVLKNFSFKGRRYLLLPYNIQAPRVLLMCGRQVEKSTLLGNKILSYTTLKKFFRSLFVTPTQKQTEVFSQDRITSPINYSEGLQIFAKGPGTKDNVLYKKFITGSDITLRYAFLSADRIRGVSADMLFIDELQDILTEVIPIIEEALSHSGYRWFRYSGTPKSHDNTIARYWEILSTQNEWNIPCDSCGSFRAKTGAGRFWNIVGKHNIGLQGLVCSRCGKRIYADHPDAQWASNYAPTDRRIYQSFRIPQLITPWVRWHEVLHKLNGYYGPQKFYNEVLGQAYDSGEKPLTSEIIQQYCLDGVSLNKPAKFNPSIAHYAGIDWGTGENSYTVITIGGYYGDVFRVVYARRFEGEEADGEVTMHIIANLIRKWKCVTIGADYGGGMDRNPKLLRTFGYKRVLLYQYAGPKDKIMFQPTLGRFMLRRTEILYDLIETIKKGEFRFPRWPEWREPFANDMVSMYSEFNESRNCVVLNKVPGATDDTLHSLLYCFLASMVVRPRPDILKPGAM